MFDSTPACKPYREPADVRLQLLDKGHRLPQKAALFVTRLVGRGEPDPVAKLALYRPAFFGRAWMRFAESIMRGPSDWTDGEREMIAAFVSQLNACPFCAGVHEGTTSLLLGSETGVDHLDNWREAGLEPRMAFAFALIERTMNTPDSVSLDESRPAISDSALEDALYVTFMFNTINRVANAFDFRWSDEADRMRLAGGLNRIRYHVPGFLLR